MPKGIGYGKGVKRPVKVKKKTVTVTKKGK